MAKTRIAILGAGPAGLGAAWQLGKTGKADVTVLEQQGQVGGNAGSFELAGLQVDFGSHRLHPACDPKILADLHELMGDDLLDRPRHGRICLQGRWLHFPLKPQDLLLQLPISFSSGIAMDTVRKALSRNGNGNGHETFTSVLEKGLGSTICRDFYFPYAEKIWGLPPEQLSATQARRRVSAGSLTKMVRKIFSVVPGFKTPGAGRFFYPRKGYGQISTAIADRACALGVDLRLDSAVKKIELGKKHRVSFENKEGLQTLEVDHVWSTIPATVLARSVSPNAPKEVLDASERVSYRAMVLVYLVIEQDQWTPFDAHYFPESDIEMTRLSEPKNYSAASLPAGRTVLCAEVPCNVNDDVWNSSEDEMKTRIQRALERCGLPIRSPISAVVIRRLPFAYPIYKDGYEKWFEIQDKWIDDLERILTFGRQGLFAHDNTHHALAMAYGAVDCLDETGVFDRVRWHKYRDDFAKHVVED